MLSKIRRGLRKPPHIIAKRIWQLCNEQLARYVRPRQAAKFNLQKLLQITGTASLAILWDNLSKRTYVSPTQVLGHEKFSEQYPHECKLIIEKASLALNKQVDLLGSGLIYLGEQIDWLKDYKTGFSWPLKYMRDIDYRNPDRPSDVKFPWELSRMQWLIPAGQAYLLAGDEQYALLVKEILEQWIDANPYACSVNWACTMEVALRIITWTWFFHVFHASRAWADPVFQQRFLSSLVLHAEFTSKHLEASDINGNHFTADAAGLCFAGLFFGSSQKSERWLRIGWDILMRELPRQVFADGVDFEASTAYHRLVLELFFLPACYREAQGLSIPETYRQRLIEMARYAQAYSRSNGSVPLWGDADDARVLPFGVQSINDHRYLSALIGVKWQIADLIEQFAGPVGEIYWLCGAEALQKLRQGSVTQFSPASKAFRSGGFYIMRNATDHIFIDCGPIGLAGRGGHGHNDCLAFEAMLDNVLLISDCGAYVYTASYEQRNLFRSTAYHNTPQIDGEEINRFIRWDDLWHFHKDAVHSVLAWKTTTENDLFKGSHSGYLRLPQPIMPKRSISLHHATHTLTIKDEFTGAGTHCYQIPLHLAANVEPTLNAEQDVILRAQGKQFLLTWKEKKSWQLAIEDARISPSYGVVVPTQKLCWQRQGEPTELTITITPLSNINAFAS